MLLVDEDDCFFSPEFNLRTALTPMVNKSQHMHNASSLSDGVLSCSSVILCKTVWDHNVGLPSFLGTNRRLFRVFIYDTRNYYTFGSSFHTENENYQHISHRWRESRTREGSISELSSRNLEAAYLFCEL